MHLISFSPLHLPLEQFEKYYPRQYKEPTPAPWAVARHLLPALARMGFPRAAGQLKRVSLLALAF